jgi:uncharacterized membrane protein YfcA
MHSLWLLFGAGLLAGTMNALAGGGSFVTLPALIAAGIPSVQANASSTVALYPGGLASAWTYHAGGGRPGNGAVCGVALWRMVAVTLAGGLAGSLLLLRTPGSLFTLALPWLLLCATLALGFGPRIAATRRHSRRGAGGPGSARVLAAQFALGVYGGYFGGAVGLMMVAAWSVLGEAEIKSLNGPRTLLVSAANTVAVAAFGLAGAVRWPETLAVLAGGLLGGAAGARLGRRLPPRLTRRLTLACTAAVTGAFFLRAILRAG